MTNENAIKEIEEIKSVIDSVFTFSVEAKKEALELAIESLKANKEVKDDG